MAAITNWALAIYQEQHIHNREDLHAFNKTVRAMDYLPFVDLALSTICTIGALLALYIPYVGSALLGLAVIFLISGGSMLRVKSSLNDLAKTVNDYWNYNLGNP